MALDTEINRRLCLNSSQEFMDWALPIPDSAIGDTDKLMLIHGYFPFSAATIPESRHEKAMRKLFPIKECLCE